MREHRRGGWWLGLLGTLLLIGCKESAKTQPPLLAEQEEEVPDAGLPTPEDAGPVDAGVPPAEEAPDAGEPDAGAPDAGPATGPALPPDASGWRFLGTAEGGPREVLGVTQDEGGNIWVAGGEDGLCLVRAGANSFQCFTLADGLHPWGAWKGKDPLPEQRYLKVTAVTGGPSGVVFVGYAGKPGCEGEFYKPPGAPKDPSIFKSGDADRVELKADGTLAVVHYDIHSPAHSVPGYGHREKLCTVNRIVWDKATDGLWFAANHGLAWGEASYQGGEECSHPQVRVSNAWSHVTRDAQGNEVNNEPRQRCKFGVMEHVHPAIQMQGTEAEDDDNSRLAGAVWGVAVRPDGDVWMGTAIRSSVFHIMTNAVGHVGTGAPWNFEMARKQTEEKKHKANRIDIWPDAVAEPIPPTREQRKDDVVSDLALMPDGTVWVSSFAWGLAKLSDTGQVLDHALTGDAERFVSSLERDSRDGSVWIGHQWGRGLMRLHTDGAFVTHNKVLKGLASQPIWDIQVVGSGDSRVVLVGFGASRDGSNNITRPGAIGIYTGR
ncbi:hypothetical protein MYSTI_07380 [Myxococcus stipitatus DSM 14675]|uniref:Lipoprotein n=1 Tax=Myxococcus stipitatus (strain DSM 14675 / JCM 12634 / Mx s8) TaxID=1278073 RepID=L7UM70_MYXSD|nr:hypothetical protein [Myxococcus stipitatus]AGC48652.1 hypothetical protein MYSTI_07380 [Myxococcus stipitatus DSM 14675]